LDYEKIYKNIAVHNSVNLNPQPSGGCKPSIIPKTMTKKKGAGAPAKYGEPTVTLAFRVPESKKEKMKQIVKQLLKEMEV
jgi:hypothetical protein